MPCSARVATLGASLLRLSPVTPISFSFPGRNVRHHVGEAGDREVGDAGQRVLVERPAALVGDGVELEAVLLLHEGEEDLGEAGGQCADADLAGLGLGRLHHLGEGVVGPRRIGRDALGAAADLRDRHQLAVLVGQVRAPQCVEDVVVEHDQPGVAVGRRLGGDRRADHAAAARLVLDHDVPAGVLDELGLDDAGDRIGRAAGREGHDELDRSLRPVGPGAFTMAGTLRDAARLPATTARRRSTDIF